MSERDRHQKFIEEMLEKAKKKDEVVPQTRCEGVDEKEIEKRTKELLEKLQQG